VIRAPIKTKEAAGIVRPRRKYFRLVNAKWKGGGQKYFKKGGGGT